MPLTFSLSLQHSGGPAIGQAAAAFAKAVSDLLGDPVAAAMVDTYDAQIAGLNRGEIDLAWLPPLMQHSAIENGAHLVAIPLRNGWMTFRCAVLVRNDSPWTSLRDVRGARAAWRDRHSASGYLFPRLEIIGTGVKADVAFSEETFHGSANAAADSVAAGNADLCTCFVSELAATDPQRAQNDVVMALGFVASKLRVLHVTDSIPPDGLVVGRHVDPVLRARTAAALHKLHLLPAGKAALQALLHADRLSPVSDAILRSLQSWAATAQARAAS